MKTFKKALALVLSLVMLVSTMTITAFATPSEQKVSLTDDEVTVEVGSVNYTGKKQVATKITVKYGDTVLKKDADYVVKDNKGGINTGDYKVVIKGKGKYKDVCTATFTIKAAPKKQQKADKNAAIKAPKKAVKASKKKAVATITVKKSKKNNAVPTYKLTKCPKGGKKFVTVNKKGKVTFKKGAKKGVYQFTVTIPAYNKFKKVTKTIKITVK